MTIPGDLSGELIRSDAKRIPLLRWTEEMCLKLTYFSEEPRSRALVKCMLSVRISRVSGNNRLPVVNLLDL